MNGVAPLPIDVIVPVYSGFAEVRACLSAVISSAQELAFEVVVIWDCGPDRAVLDYIRELAAKRQITLLENDSNVGFVETANRGMRLHKDRDVILLNSDTVVANDWLDRLVAAAYSDDAIATVTPFSNNAEICSFPRTCASNELPEGVDVISLDRIFADYVTPAVLDIPTGVGFCMFIRRSATDLLGLFDVEAFGRGYGEENDFCRRAAAAGMRNVLATNVFVFHAGGVSFGGTKQARTARAMALLDKRYPDYHRLVHEHIAQDPARPWRLQAMLALLRSDRRRKVLAIVHNLGGGTVKHVRELVAHCSDDVAFLLARPKSGSLLEIELPGSPDHIYIDLESQCRELRGLCEWVGIGAIHLHHIQGIEAYVVSLLHEVGLPYVVTLHDYYLINGNPTLTDERGVFCVDARERDDQCKKPYPVPLGMTASQWRDYTGQLLAGAQVVISPSRYTADLFADYFPSVRFTTVWHPDRFDHENYPPACMTVWKASEPLRVVVVGAINREKGADILESVAKRAAVLRLPIEFHLLGYAYRQLHESVITHGPYDDAELPRHLHELAPHLAWFPAQWPETYCYTLSACIEAGLPVVASRLGAFEERLHGRPLSWLVDDWSDTTQWLAVLEQIGAQIRSMSTDTATAGLTNDRPAVGDDWYVCQYPAIVRETAPGERGPDAELLQLLVTGGGDDGIKSRRQRLLRLLIMAREWPGLRWCARMIPFNWQQGIKRRLSASSLREFR